MFLTIQGLVLRVTNYNDTDSLLTVLTRDRGKMTLKARGLRRKNSPLSAPCQLLTYSEFTVFENRGYFSTNEGISIEIFAGLRKDLQKLSLGTYFAQVAELVCMEDTPNPELLSLVLNCLYGLSALDLPENQVKAVFEMRVACIAGYMPDLSGCCSCGRNLPDLFNISQGHLVCRECLNRDNGGIRVPVSTAALAAMRYITQCHEKKLFSFYADDESLEQLTQVTEAYLTMQLERGFSTLDFYKSLLLK